MEISRTIAPADLKISLPENPKLEIQDFLLGYEVRQSSYVASVWTDSSGRTSGGGTRYTNYKVYDFGYSVSNRSNIAMRVYFHIVKVDDDGYTLSDHHVWKDVEAGEKRRIWAGFMFSNIRDFHQYKIKGIHVGETPRNRNDGAHWLNSTSPNRSIYHITGIDKIEDTHSKWLLVLIIGVAIALFMMLT